MFLISICLIILIGFIITIFIIVSKKTKTKLKLKRIKIASKSNENILVEGMNTTISLNKVIIYDISEYKQFTTGIENNTIYTYSILLVNKCLNTKKEIEDCEITGINNFRNLEKSKEEPSICLFNITNNNIILSIKCPMYFSENQKSEIISDLNLNNLIDFLNIDENININLLNKTDSCGHNCFQETYIVNNNKSTYAVYWENKTISDKDGYLKKKGNTNQLYFYRR